MALRKRIPIVLLIALGITTIFMLSGCSLPTSQVPRFQSALSRIDYKTIGHITKETYSDLNRQFTSDDGGEQFLAIYYSDNPQLSKTTYQIALKRLNKAGAKCSKTIPDNPGINECLGFNGVAIILRGPSGDGSYSKHGASIRITNRN